MDPAIKAREANKVSELRLKKNLAAQGEVQKLWILAIKFDSLNKKGGTLPVLSGNG